MIFGFSLYSGFSASLHKRFGEVGDYASSTRVTSYNSNDTTIKTTQEMKVVRT